MDPRSLAAASSAHARSQALARTSVVSPAFDHTASVLGAYPAASGAAAAQPFFQDQNLVLSRPAHLRDYQADSSAYPYRSAAPLELAPYIPPRREVAMPELPRLSFSSEAEQKWLSDREASERSLAQEREADSLAQARDHSQPPPPFVSKLGFRQAAPMPQQPPAIKEHCHQDGVSKEFFCTTNQQRATKTNWAAGLSRSAELT